MWGILKPLIESLVETTAPLRATLDSARQTVKNATEQLAVEGDKERRLKNLRHQLRGRDPRALAMSLWKKVVVLVGIVLLDGPLNYLAGEGVSDNTYIAWLVAAALTALQAWLAWSVGREIQARRREAIRGEVKPKASWLIVHAGALGIYVVASTIMRQRYFELDNALTRAALGSSAHLISPWIIASVLTAVSVGLLALATYIIAHSDSELANCESELAGTKATISNLERSKRDGESLEKETRQLVRDQVVVAHAHAMSKLQLSADPGALAELSDYVFQVFWVAATGGSENLPENPSSGGVELPKPLSPSDNNTGDRENVPPPLPTAA
jgi:hypothetical protein